jgi:enterochelin esterase family protein
MEATIEIPSWATHVASDHTDMDRNPHPVDAAKVARFTLELPDDVYFEYGFLDREGELRPDPANERRADNPWYPNASALVGPDYAPDPHAEVDADRAAGSLDRLRWESERLGEVRRATVYTPAGSTGPLPTLVLQDGTAYLRIARLPAVLESLLEAGEIAPARLVMIEPQDRRAEYGFNAAYRDFVVEDVLPRVAAEHGEPTNLLLMGASLGGLFSMTLALHHPELIAGVAAQSGAFLGTPEEPEPYDNDRSWVLQTLADREGGGPWRAYTEVGTIEWLMDVNRRVHEHLERGDGPHAYAERNAGHNWVNWRNGLAAALRFLLPPS